MNSSTVYDARGQQNMGGREPLRNCGTWVLRAVPQGGADRAERAPVHPQDRDVPNADHSADGPRRAAPPKKERLMAAQPASEHDSPANPVSSPKNSQQQAAPPLCYAGGWEFRPCRAQVSFLPGQFYLHTAKPVLGRVNLKARSFVVPLRSGSEVAAALRSLGGSDIEVVWVLEDRAAGTGKKMFQLDGGVRGEILSPADFERKYAVAGPLVQQLTQESLGNVAGGSVQVVRGGVGGALQVVKQRSCAFHEYHRVELKQSAFGSEKLSIFWEVWECCEELAKK